MVLYVFVSKALTQPCRFGVFKRKIQVASCALVASVEQVLRAFDKLPWFLWQHAKGVPAEPCPGAVWYTYRSAYTKRKVMLYVLRLRMWAYINCTLNKPIESNEMLFADQRITWPHAPHGTDPFVLEFPFCATQILRYQLVLRP